MIVGLADAPDAWPMIEEIFFLSSSVQTFDTDDARQRFLEAWTGYYRESEPDGIYLCLTPDKRVAGYLMGCRDSRAARRLYADIAGTIAMDRFATADEIARPILWMLSDAASFISGACLDASGGGFLIDRR